ncbi:MAG: sialate O-acetylesterase [Leptolyngbya foveolarum]|uniref:Sialate O-acetylesterase n=1 Tax=Leptolyngbya foveolarum TaxID=47253 RepID=A0A2W4UI71_9CYAN|nr:MAG: sialate O-acetylesterase [Leptolyngbya foveolarum]
MKRAISTTTAFGFILALGVGAGIVSQKYLNVSTQIGALMKQVGIYDYFHAPTAALEDPLVPVTIPEPVQGKLKLYVLVGQSNMVGKSAVPDGFELPQNTYTFGNDYQWHRATSPVDSAEGQVDQVSADEGAGFGPALAFARSLSLSNTEQAIGLIPCAKDGSSITEWEQALSDQSLYGSCLKRVRAASTMGTVSGILFFQGEADTIDPTRFPDLRPAAESWAEKFATFAYNFRQDIGKPETPLVYAQLGQPDDLQGLPNWPLVQQQQENIQIPNAKMIKTNDLPMVSLHYTADGYVAIGERFAEAIEQIESATATSNESPKNPDSEL